MHGHHVLRGGGEVSAAWRGPAEVVYRLNSTSTLHRTEVHGTALLELLLAGPANPGPARPGERGGLGGLEAPGPTNPSWPSATNGPSFCPRLDITCFQL